MRVKAAPMRRSSSIRAATAFACLSSKTTGLLAAFMTWLEDVSGATGRGMVKSLRSLYVTESRPLDLKSRLGLERNVADFTANMLALAVAVGPDK